MEKEMRPTTLGTVMTLAVVAGVFCVGCQKNSSGELASAEKLPPTDARDAKILDLESQLDQYRADSKYSSQTITDLQSHCGQGERPDGSMRFAVSTADSPQALMQAVNKVYSDEGIEPHELTDLKVKHIRLPLGKNYPDVICLDFPAEPNGMGASQTCFDPMEITER